MHLKDKDKYDEGRCQYGREVDHVIYGGGDWTAIYSGNDREELIYAMLDQFGCSEELVDEVIEVLSDKIPFICRECGCKQARKDELSWGNESICRNCREQG